MFCIDIVKYSPHARSNAHSIFNTIEHGHVAMQNEYLESFMSSVYLIMYSGGEIGVDSDMIKLAGVHIAVEYHMLLHKSYTWSQVSLCADKK